jgi:hypothetical protein
MISKKDEIFMSNYIEELKHDHSLTEDEIRKQFLKKFPGNEYFYSHYSLERLD